MMTNIPYGKQTINNEDIEGIIDSLNKDYLTTGPKVLEFEDSVKKYTNSKYAVAVSSGTAALHCVCSILDFKHDDEIIVSDISFMASANCVVYCGAKPIFCDVQEDTMNIDPDQIEKLITSKTKAIICVDYAGQLCDYEKIVKIKNKYNLILIEDAAHSFGCSNVGKYTDLTIFSFHPVKNITTGEGGMVITNNKNYYKKLCEFRNHGLTKDYIERNKLISHEYDMVSLGYNYRLCDILCSLGITQLQKLDKFIQIRNKIANYYIEQFKDVNTITLLTNKFGSAYHIFVIKLNLNMITCDRDTIFREMKKKNIHVNVHYKPIHLFTFYKNKFNTNEGNCPVAENLYMKILTLPIYPELSLTDQNYVIKTLKEILLRYTIL